MINGTRASETFASMLLSWPLLPSLAKLGADPDALPSQRILTVKLMQELRTRRMRAGRAESDPAPPVSLAASASSVLPASIFDCS